LRNALTGRSDGSGDGVDQPKDLPDHEQIDFLLQYDQTDPFCHKIVIKKVERDELDNSGDEDDGDIGIDDNLSNGPDFDNIETRDRAEGDVSQEKRNSEVVDQPQDDQHEGGSNDAAAVVETPDDGLLESNTEAFTGKKYKDVKEISFPSLDEAIDMKFDLNAVTNI